MISRPSWSSMLQSTLSTDGTTDDNNPEHCKEAGQYGANFRYPLTHAETLRRTTRLVNIYGQITCRGEGKILRGPTPTRPHRRGRGGLRCRGKCAVPVCPSGLHRTHFCGASWSNVDPSRPTAVLNVSGVSTRQDQRACPPPNFDWFL